jgi:hypothetical protein
LPIEKIAGCDPIVWFVVINDVPLIEGGEAIRLPEGQRPEQKCIYHAENGGIGA